MNETNSSRHRGVTAGGDGECRPRLADADRGRTDDIGSWQIIGDVVARWIHDRCCTLADRVTTGGIGFIDAVDLAYSAAQFSGLADRVGDDAVQAVMGSAFMGCHS
jgi:hypothetical protein